MKPSLYVVYTATPSVAFDDRPRVCSAHLMPCGNIDETIEIELDAEDRILNYRLTKTTCGAPVADAQLLLPTLQGMAAADILRLRPPADFLRSKHLDAVQALLACSEGVSWHTSRAVVLSSIASLENSEGTSVLQLRGSVAVAMVDASIEKCAGCGSA